MVTIEKPACELCHPSGEHVLWQDKQLRIVLASDPDYPGFCRVIWNQHIREMTDLNPADRQLIMNTVFAVEAAIRETYQPQKINLASFGNQVPHLHWHIIPRWETDKHFPQPIWGQVQRPGNPVTPGEPQRLQASLLHHLAHQGA